MMLLYNLILALLLLIPVSEKPSAYLNDNSCNLKGDWAEVSYMISPQGKLQSLSLSKNTSSDSLQLFAATIHSIYYSGQGNMGIESGFSLKISRSKICYKEHSMGRYQIDQNCSMITFTDAKRQSSQMPFTYCQIRYLFENILVLQQDELLAYYLRRDPQNPYFVGD